MFEDKSRLYIGLAFAGGILITLGYKDLYPDLERRFRASNRWRSRRQSLIATSKDEIRLEDHSDRDPDSPSPTAAREYEIKEGIEGTIGNTPMIRIMSLSDYTGCDILAKAEFLNGAGNSPKDRVALNMITTAEEEGLLVPGRGDCIYEGTVGSTGISLAAIARARGYRAHMYVSMLTISLLPSHSASPIPPNQSPEKSSLLLKLGATLTPVPPAPIILPTQFVNLARRLAAEHTADPLRPGRGYFADQFENPANYLAHLTTTGPEIYAQTGGRLDAFVAGAGTGGTISGVALALKERIPGGKVRVVLADPQGSGLYNKVKHGVMFAGTEREGTRRRHQVDSIVEGIGVNRVTANFEAGRELVDDAVRVSDEQAIGMARWLVERDGIFIGSSSAVNCVAAVKVAKELGPGHRVVTILCDSGNRHLSKFWAQAGNIGDKDDADLDAILSMEV
ncbi:tryptophan synthase beta subunit-like PLP-dependent enzyme [Elsinoe ampelina]|uniref:Cysteine synthase 2 n=1 Tax=Elsinoe ampelina TaxID=302913 RepID=A0A6A6GEW3_9PEZI|nr:tryptophan synthase beta subunit-like PLP-dependent enzyme [Elsinoe ampelina]